MHLKYCSINVTCGELLDDFRRRLQKTQPPSRATEPSDQTMKPSHGHPGGWLIRLSVTVTVVFFLPPPSPCLLIPSAASLFLNPQHFDHCRRQNRVAYTDYLTARSCRPPQPTPGLEWLLRLGFPCSRTSEPIPIKTRTSLNAKHEVPAHSPRLGCLRMLTSFLHIPPPPPYRARASVDTTAPALLRPLNCAPVFLTSTRHRPRLNPAEVRTLLHLFQVFSHPQPRVPQVHLGNAM
jgi:hypothetical protein